MVGALIAWGKQVVRGMANWMRVQTACHLIGLQRSAVKRSAAGGKFRGCGKGKLR